MNVIGWMENVYGVTSQAGQNVSNKAMFDK